MRVSIAAPQAPFADLLPKGSFVLIGMMRSGSNFLERQLNLLPDVRCHGELFNPTFVGFSHDFPDGLEGYNRENTRIRNKDVLGFLKKIADVSDRKHFGFRIFLDHSPQVISEVLYNPAVRKIVLTRNLLEAYVSLKNALETGVWLVGHEQKIKPSAVNVDVADLLTFSLRQALFYNDVLTILQRTGQAFVQIDYTEIKQLDRINEMIELIGSEHRLDKVKEPIKKQATGLLSERIENYQELLDALQQRKLARWFI